MPELPEVETLCRGLWEALKPSPRIAEIECFRPDLRYPLPVEGFSQLKGQKVLAVRRRAKYILMDTTDHCLVNHLGMSGFWRVDEKTKEFGKHDHVVIRVGRRRLVYNDARRFGFFFVVPKGEEVELPGIKTLGPEPLDVKSFDFDQFSYRAKKSQSSIKAFLMDQKNIVGVGNIYASEALFLSGIRPTRKASRLSKVQLTDLLKNVRLVLQKAIKVGGSSIRDFKHTNGKSGGFQNLMKVYGRENQYCLCCKNANIRKTVIVGRSTFWCPQCQK